jgi:DNA replication protein DnaC
VSPALAFALTATTATTATFTSSAVVLDQEVGYIPFDHDAANLFLQLVASRYEQGSILVTSNLPFGRWGEVFGDEVVAAAMIDRLVHHAEVLTLAGDSYRTRARRELLAKDRDH